MNNTVNPESVLSLTAPCDEYLCPLSANKYGIDFLKFDIRDYDTGKVVYQVSREPDLGPIPDDLDPETEDMIRSVRYCFPEEFLRFKTVRTSLQFAVGPEPVNNFRMIERHYFRGKLIRSYDFTFGFCIPNSTNSWEAIYPMPDYTPEEMADFVENPFEHRSDSFYFVDNALIMHNKAEYQYITEKS